MRAREIAGHYHTELKLFREKHFFCIFMLPPRRNKIDGIAVKNTLDCLGKREREEEIKMGAKSENKMLCKSVFGRRHDEISSDIFFFFLASYFFCSQEKNAPKLPIFFFLEKERNLARAIFRIYGICN